MEELVRLIRYVLAFWGLVYIITQSSIMAGFRKNVLRGSTFVATLIYCPACTGFWVGLLFGTLGIYGKGLSSIPNVVMLEAALSGTALGCLWGVYWGDHHALERDYHVLARELEQEQNPEVVEGQDHGTTE
jgi:hypothetical protein